MKLPLSVLALLLAACAPATQAPRPSPAAAVPPVPAKTAEPAARAPAIAVAPPPAPSPPPKVEPAPATQPPAAKAPAAKAPTPAPPKAATAPAPKPAPTTAAAKPAAAPTAAAPLDLKSLEQRLKETPAIGIMTKLSLKNQVDDLLEQFRAHHQGKAHSLAELRRPYELLLMKVLALLQDGDPPLARAINASREAIWSILADREKFSRMT